MNKNLRNGPIRCTLPQKPTAIRPPRRSAAPVGRAVRYGRTPARTPLSKKTLAIITVVAAAVAAALGLSLLLNPHTGPAGVQAHIVYQASTANDAAITLPDSLVATLRGIGQHNGSISLTRIDGATAQTSTIDLTPRTGSAADSPELKVAGRRADAINSTIAALQNTIRTAQASTGTRALYAGLLTTAFTPGVPVYLIGSLLDLANPDDTRKLGFDTAPATVVKAVNATGDVPALAGNDVTFIPVGTAGTQQPMRTPQEQYQQAMWTALLLNGHAKTVTFADPTTGPATSSTPAPAVQIPPLPGTPGAAKITASRNGEAKQTVCTLAASTYFIPDTATLIDRQGTIRDLTNCVNSAEKNTTITLDAWVAYYGPLTAAGTPATNTPAAIQLSTARNHAIADLLVGMGINRTRITQMTGHGTDDQPYPADPTSPRNRVCQITFHTA